MGIDSHYGDEDLKESGKWFPIRGEETQLKIRHAGNDDYVRYLGEHLPEEARQYFARLSDVGGIIQDRDSIPEMDDDVAEEALKVLREAAAHHLLIDWKNLSVDSKELAGKFDKAPGETIGYSTERAVTLLEEIPGLYREVKDVAQDESKFQQKRQEQDIKN